MITITGHEEYLASRDGRIFSTKYGKFRELKFGSAKGYSNVTLCKLGEKKRTYTVHRLVYETFVGEVPEGLQINHINGDRLDNRISNLEVVTARENVQHSWDIGLCTARYGKDNPAYRHGKHCRGYTHESK